MSERNDFEDLAWERANREMRHMAMCAVATRLVACRPGQQPAYLQRLIEQIVGAPYSRLYFELDPRTYAVTEVRVVSPAESLGALLGMRAKPAHC